MVDISSALQFQMQENQCSPIYAFFLLSEGDKDGVRLLQSQSKTKSGRRLRDKSNIQTDK